LSSIGVSTACSSPRATSKDILDILFLGDIKAIRGGRNLNPKKVVKRTKISRKKLLTKVGLNKGNLLRVITSDNHVIDIEKKGGQRKHREHGSDENNKKENEIGETLVRWVESPKTKEKN
jgi:hypothetical protein